VLTLMRAFMQVLVRMLLATAATAALQKTEPSRQAVGVPELLGIYKLCGVRMVADMRANWRKQR
jgi:hypothetical protein